MSASSKKKLRNEQEAEKLTEKQLTEKHEAKKLKIMTTTFVVVLCLMVAFAIYTAVSSHVSHNGSKERNTTALTVGEHKISNAELNYYYIDAINQFVNQYGAYAAMFGLDVTKPLNQQVTNAEKGTTWADDFLETAKNNVKSTYALADKAAADGFELPEANKTYINSTVDSLGVFAKSRGFTSAENYLKAMYGNGATVEDYRNYAMMTSLASAYQADHAKSLEYTDEQLREAEKDNYAEFSSFSYNAYYLDASKFLEGGTKGEDDKITYSDEEKAAAVKRAEEIAKSLASENITSVADLDKAIAELEINKDVQGAASTAYTDAAYAKINANIQEWVTDEARQAGDLTVIANTTTTTDEEGKETTTTNGYYVVFFNSSNDNTFPLVNARHILIKFEGGTKGANGTVTYTDEEKAATKAKAEAILADWQAGEATEESFGKLATEKTQDTGSAANGGLYENIYPNQMVAGFNNWCFDSARQPGDTGIVETEFGYHIMYFSGNSNITFRDFMIKDKLVAEDTSKWYTELVDAVTLTEVDTQYINKAMILSVKG